ncbi:hypothetical protein ACGFK1_23755 [Mycobacterium sp. NPDC048908]|uniref:hypothetical protein n=1 Tax=Mycobacterium sp. NPDC048908 TaxID=3364292 RepID=UPI00370FF622
MSAPRSYYAAPEGVAVTAVYNRAFGTFFDFFEPRIFVDGVEASVAGWGRTAVPAATGSHHVHVHTKYFFPRRTGPADYTVDVPPGAYVELEYRAPIFTFSRGSLGPPPQRYNGVWPVVILVGSCLLLIAILFIAAA